MTLSSTKPGLPAHLRGGGCRAPSRRTKLRHTHQTRLMIADYPQAVHKTHNMWQPRVKHAPHVGEPCRRGPVALPQTPDQNQTPSPCRAVASHPAVAGFCGCSSEQSATVTRARDSANGGDSVTGCFHCGADDHFSRDCPQAQPAAKTAAGSRPDWCGECDLQTRLVDHGGYMRRCPACHPKRHQPLPQHRRCGGCKWIVYAWDHERCGGHRDVQGGGAGRGVPDPELASLRRQMGWSQGSIGEQS